MFRDISHKNQMVRIMTLGKINTALQNYTEENSIKALDERLLKGFYTSRPSELDKKYMLMKPRGLDKENG